MLDPVSEIDIYCLHVVYKPVIAQFVLEFVESWNKHHLRTVRGNPSPEKLFFVGLRKLENLAEENGRLYRVESGIIRL